MITSYTLFLWLTIATIVSQTIHTWFVFQSFSRLPKYLKTFQAVIFCSILSVAIFAFATIGEARLAMLGAFIEIVVNVYYYGMDYFEKGIEISFKRMSTPDPKLRWNDSILRFWRHNWIAFFFGLLLPMLIYIFSMQMIKLKH
jgi:hypothetical protein